VELEKNFGALCHGSCGLSKFYRNAAADLGVLLAVSSRMLTLDRPMAPAAQRATKKQQTPCNLHIN